MWILQMNDMRTKDDNGAQRLCQAETKEELQKFVAGEEAEKPYIEVIDGVKILKTYKKGGPLEWKRPAGEMCEAFVDMHDRDWWINTGAKEGAKQAVEYYQSTIAGVPTLKDAVGAFYDE